MMDEDIRAKMRELMEVARRAFQAHLQTGTGGNISIRTTRGDRVVIKPSGVGFRECSEENLLVVDLEGKILHGSAKPSKDMPFHLGIYRVRQDVNGIVHVHSPWATAWASAGREIPTVTVHSKNKLGRIPLVPLAPGGGSQTPESVVEVFRDPDVAAAVLENHGSVGVGKSLLAAEHIAELVEETAQVAAVARLLRVE
jgi:L-fuculose-phosphate aldolase/L-ribulose-5-phosphate 4-epimerase